MYDPRKDGARCDDCWMRDRRAGAPVRAEINPDARALIIGEAPGKEEVAEGRPFVGQSGAEATTALRLAGWVRDRCSWTNVLCCRPPDNDLDRCLTEWQRANKLRLKTAPTVNGAPAVQPMPHPFDCCRPRLLAEVRRYGDYLTMGSRAMRALLQTNRGILAMRGGCVEGGLDADGNFHFAPVPAGCHPMRVLPAMHPAFILRRPSMRVAFRCDVAKAVRWFEGRLGWQEPVVSYIPTPAQLERFLFEASEPIAFDVETEYRRNDPATHSPTRSRLRCLGLATTTEAMIVPFLGVDGATTFYTAEDQTRIDAILRRWFSDEKRAKTGHNAGYYDRLVVEARGWRLR